MKKIKTSLVKKMLSFLLAFLLAIVSIPSMELSVFAVTDDSESVSADAAEESVGASSETESNDDYASANNFSLNSTISGKMGDSNDKDYFKITPSQNGKISLTLSHNYSSNSEIYWNISMYAYSSGNYTEFYNQRIYANSGETNKLASIGAASGTTYYIRISTYYSATAGFNYNLKNEFNSTNYYEKEINSDYSSATSMSFNQTYGGVMNGDNDVDYYKFSPSQNGKISLNFTHAQSDNSEIYWNISMYAYSSGNYTEFYNQRIYANSGETNKLASIGAASGTTYYIRISTYYNATTGFDYNIENSFTVTDYYEKEINNNYALATPMSFNQTYGGVMNDDDDVDVYKFSPSQDGKISLTFSHDYSSNGEIYWYIVMYAYSSGNYTEFYNQRIYANSGETNKLSPIGASSGTTYYLKIYTYYNATTGFEYSLRNEFTATNYYEKEINKEYSSATQISLGASYGGVMNDDDDIDIYKITVSNTSTPFYFSHDYVNNSEVYWNVKIVDANSYSEEFSTRISGSDSNGVITSFDSAGTYYIHISTYYNATINYEYSLLIGDPDSTKPSAAISSTNNVAVSQTVTLSMSDNVGLAGYYWGTSSSLSPTFTSISGKNYSTSIYNFSSIGKYYLTVKDTSGNVFQTSATFYKTTLNANGGTVTPTTVITMSRNSFTFPTPTPSSSEYSYNGWSTSSSATSGAKTLTPSSSTTYYAVWKPNPAPTNAKLTVESKTASSGKEVKLAVSLSENPGLAYLKLKVSYNASALEFVSAQNTGRLTGTFTTSKTTDVNPYVIQWMGADNSNGNGTIMNLTFRVKENAAEGNYTISLTPEEAYNSSYDDVTFTVTNGVITVKNVIAGDVNGDGTINGKDGILLSQYLADWDVTIVDAAADCNGDGIINGKDGILLSQYLADWDVTLG